MNTTDGGLPRQPPLSLKQAPTCFTLFQNRENKRIPENSGVFYIFFEKAAIYDRKITANYSI